MNLEFAFVTFTTPGLVRQEEIENIMLSQVVLDCFMIFFV